MEVGGFTPGFFSDDLDLTVRLNLRGYKVAYAPEIQFGEKHPGNHSSYRQRSYKWPTAACKLASALPGGAEKQTVKPGGEVGPFSCLAVFMWTNRIALVSVRHVSSRAFPLDRVHREHRHGLFRRELNHPDNVFTVLAYFAKDPVRQGSQASGDVRPVYGTTDFPRRAACGIA